ncbi:eukaryotic translation initiation factor 5B isoform X2 [Gadus morhua]|uniref:eukaryotic translation initiation factor 5B isoform X2 n=1 Tax=Gadus morhua TaxID=8049 RepID=UPI0011B7E00F|nr:eukaryotic translation initiation factor 5B-like isoform X2 [Gadus morhua]
MEEQQRSVVLLDRTIFQLALQTRELSRRRDELTLQIKACGADITERKSFTETMHKHIKDLEEEITVMQNTVKQIKDNAKSMKANNRLLQHYEMTLKEELEKKQENYIQDKKEYEERIASYRNVFQQHKEFYCRNPLAKQLLAIQSEKEDIEGRIKALEDQIALKQEDVLGAAVNSSLSESQAESVSAQLTEAEPVAQRDQQPEVEASFSIASLHLNPTEEPLREVDNISLTGEEICGDAMNKRSAPETLCYPPGSNREAMAQKPPSDQRSGGAEPDQQWGPKTQDEPAGLPAREEEMMEEEEEEEQPLPLADEEGDAVDDDDDDDQRDNAPPHSFLSPMIQPQSAPGRMKLVPSTPTFSINSSPSVSPGPVSSHRKSPTFLFSTTSDPSTPSFSGFGFDMGSAQEEDSPFAFTSSYFSGKKGDSESPSGPGFLFNEAQRPEGEFHFSFSSKRPVGSGASQDEPAKEEVFPFSFTYS